MKSSLNATFIFPLKCVNCLLFSTPVKIYMPRMCFVSFSSFIIAIRSKFGASIEGLNHTQYTWNSVPQKPIIFTSITHQVYHSRNKKTECFLIVFMCSVVLSFVYLYSLFSALVSLLKLNSSKKATYYIYIIITCNERKPQTTTKKLQKKLRTL